MKDSAKRYVYADNAATTAVSPQVVEAMLPYLTEHFGNPSSLYMLGQTAHNAVKTARGRSRRFGRPSGRNLFYFRWLGGG